MSTSSLQTELTTLLAELAALQAKAGSASGSTPTHYVFTRNLSIGMTGSDVSELQRYLLAQDAASPAATKLSNHGTTQNFGTLTLNALIEFQKKEGSHPPPVSSVRSRDPT